VRVLPERGDGLGGDGGGILPSPTPDDGSQQAVTPWDWWFELPLPLGGR